MIQHAYSMIDEMKIIERWDQLRQKAMEYNLFATSKNGQIEVFASWTRRSVHDSKSWWFRDLDSLAAWLDGITYQHDYAAKLGFDQKQAEQDHRDEQDRQRILDALTKD